MKSFAQQMLSLSVNGQLLGGGPVMPDLESLRLALVLPLAVQVGDALAFSSRCRHERGGAAIAGQVPSAPVFVL